MKEVTIKAVNGLPISKMEELQDHNWGGAINEFISSVQKRLLKDNVYATEIYLGDHYNDLFWRTGVRHGINYQDQGVGKRVKREGEFIIEYDKQDELELINYIISVREGK